VFRSSGQPTPDLQSVAIPSRWSPFESLPDSIVLDIFHVWIRKRSVFRVVPR